MQSQKIVILGTGGTIAGSAADPADNIGYVAAQVGVLQLIAAIPSFAGAENLLAEQVAQLDSKDMSFAVWTHLARRTAHYLEREDVQGIVITHGTDTLEETAYFLQAVLNPSKPVVLTCAMRPASALVPDGPQNILDGVAVAAHEGARGVTVVCAGQIHSALDVQKIHTYKVDAFGSGDAGPVGYVEEGTLRLLRNWPGVHAQRAQVAIKNIADSQGRAWPKVDIVMNYAGVDGSQVEALVAAGVRGIVIAATGNGTLHQDMESALLKARAAGVRVVRASRCTAGQVLAKPDDLFEDSRGLSPVKARIALILELMG